jgi:5-methylcytosine-specific restriction endonuclease McrA
MPTGVYVRTKPSSNIGRKLSSEMKKRISDTLKSKGIKPIKPFRWAKGQRSPFSKDWLQKLSDSHKGYKMPEEQKRKISEDHLRNREKSHLWKGGITPLNQQIRHSLEYKLWRKSVFERDNYTCIWCGQKSKNIEADHIKPFCDYPELRFAIDNGRTLCEDCHKKTKTYGGRIK